MHAASPMLATSVGASDPTSGGCASTSPTLGTQCLLVPLPPGRFCPHRLPLHPLLCPHPSYLRRSGLALPHLRHWPFLPLPLCFHPPLRPSSLPLSRQDISFFKLKLQVSLY
ncbi:hypothetical protein BHE74_00009614 [Ensete ventricosum]|nr:hypothetical protein BHE74_00009614 [Ensete ventricosum]